jgi:hypothetical protein
MVSQELVILAAGTVHICCIRYRQTSSSIGGLPSQVLLALFR